MISCSESKLVYLCLRRCWQGAEERNGGGVGEVWTAASEGGNGRSQRTCILSKSTSHAVQTSQPPARLAPSRRFGAAVQIGVKLMLCV